MDLDTTESWVKIAGGVIAAAAAILATFKALAEWRRSTEQRAEELNLRQREFRHKQAIFARDLISEVFEDRRSRAALTMLDWTSFDHKDEAGITYTIDQGEIKEAMNPSRAANEKEVFIRTRFEALYDHLEQIEHLISLGIVNFADVEIPFRYYMINLLSPDIRHDKFLDYFDYPGVKAFASHFQEKQPPTNT
jgi:hypothetical protein